MTLEQFHWCFTNSLSREASDAVYERYYIPGAGRLFFQAGFANFNPKAATKVDYSNPSRPPLLLLDRRRGPHLPAIGQQGELQQAAQGAVGNRASRVSGSLPLPGPGRLGGSRRPRPVLDDRALEGRVAPEDLSALRRSRARGDPEEEEARPQAARAVARQEADDRPKRPHGRYSELYGLGLVAAGLFLGIVLYGGWDGGMVGGPLSDGVHGFVGAAAYLVPLGVRRRRLADGRAQRAGRLPPVSRRPRRPHVRPADDARHRTRRLSRLGLRRRSRRAARSRRADLGILALVVGGLLLSGASAGALLRRSHHAVRTAARQRRPTTACHAAAAQASGAAQAAARRRARVPGRRRREEQQQPLLVRAEPLDEDPPTLFDVTTRRSTPSTSCRIAASCTGRSRTGRPIPPPRTGSARLLVQTLEHFGIDATLIRAHRRPARHALRAAARARHQGVEGLARSRTT